jgi:long-chain acyl-CoA synthetase
MPDSLKSIQNSLALWNNRINDAINENSLSNEILDLAETLIKVENVDSDIILNRTLHEFLETTSQPEYLQALGSHDNRLRWVDICFKSIKKSDYSFLTMMENRVEKHGDQTLFEVFGDGVSLKWSYTRVLDSAKGFAASFLKEESKKTRVALFTSNCVEGACCDLACLLYDILNTPLNIHFDRETLVWIFDRLKINIAVADSESRVKILQDVRKKTKRQFKIFSFVQCASTINDSAIYLHEYATRLTPDIIQSTLDSRRRIGLDDIATVMFTSGSTGKAKGVTFSIFNLISKRFARAAALPSVGKNEVLFCYLPLFHTFGRYLEMMGMIFWHGKYVFAGNPSSETFFKGLNRYNPTGIISIPLRWVQIREKVIKRIETGDSNLNENEIFRSIVGENLRWGLSAAGYLEPKAFRFFHKNRIELSSGFGMTEATGGITMSPPGDYVENSVGKALPGMDLSFTDQGEMLISGAYVGRYLKQDGVDLEVDEPIYNEDGEWLSTGDLFKPLENEHLTIVDRVKDIYKNNRGQTVAPRKIEKKFASVPGIKNTFLVGDHRSYNTLLIVPDEEDTILKEIKSEDDKTSYYHKIITVANQDLAPYERVVNFEILKRDFDADFDEITPKGSFKRKNIEKNFESTISTLYQKSYVEYQIDGLEVRIPIWFYRDLGILKESIQSNHNFLFDIQRNLSLDISRSIDGRVKVGDLEYPVNGSLIDLGLFARQPMLWIGNPSLIQFSPIKTGWDIPHPDISYRALINGATSQNVDFRRPLENIADSHLVKTNLLIQTALFGSKEEIVSAIDHLKMEFIRTGDRVGEIVRRRISALSCHHDEDIRCLAYRTLLLDEPMLNYGKSFPTFIKSGLTFINEESIKIISEIGFEQRRLDALRKRLYSYREQLDWPSSETTVSQINNVLKLLVRFVYKNPEYYRSVRAELASWILHRDENRIANYAQSLLNELVKWFEDRLEMDEQPHDSELLESKLIFDEDLSDSAAEFLKDLLTKTIFLKQSIILIFDDNEFDIEDVQDEGIWVSGVQSRGILRIYRASINTNSGKHYDLMITRRMDMNAQAVQDTNHWMMVIAGYPYGQRVIPSVGCIRPELAAMSLEYVNELRVWDKIREFSSIHNPSMKKPVVSKWLKLYGRAMSTFFMIWRNSGKHIIPGFLSPNNVVVPEMDFSESALVLSLSDWQPYENTLSIFKPLYLQFFKRVQAHFPSSMIMQQQSWLFESCMEGLGDEEGLAFLEQFKLDIESCENHPFDETFVDKLDRFIIDLKNRWRIPLAVLNAIERYRLWKRINHKVTAEAEAELIDGLVSMYHLERYGDIARYYLYRKTYFSHSIPDVIDQYDLLLDAMWLKNEIAVTQLVELSDLQKVLISSDDRDVFSHLVFPKIHSSKPLEVLTFGDSDNKHVVVRTLINDIRGEEYNVRQAVEPEEIGQLYRLFFQEHFPKEISDLDQFLIVIDNHERVIAGICYRLQEKKVIHLDSIVVTRQLMGRKIASNLLEEFVSRMAVNGVKVIKTDFQLREFCGKRGFAVNSQWGGLVRFISDEEKEISDDIVLNEL